MLEPGHEETWRRLDKEKRKALTPLPGTPGSDLLKRGQHLSTEVAKLLRAVERASGHRRT